MNSTSHIQISVFIFVLISLTGCLRKPKVTSFSKFNNKTNPNGFVKGSSFVILGPTSQNIKKGQNPSQTQELKENITNSLKNSGYFVGTFSDADYALTFDYALEMRDKIKKQFAQVILPGSGFVQKDPLAEPDCKQSSIIVKENKEYMPKSELYQVYSATLLIDVYQAKEFKKFLEGHTQEKPQRIWHGLLRSENEYQDFKGDLDFLLGKLFDLFGKNSPFFTETENETD